jgi:hypothetical protein
MMEIKDMNNVNEILRHLIYVQREIKTKMSEEKQLKDRLNQLYDEGKIE